MFRTIFDSEDLPPGHQFEQWHDVMLRRSAPVLVTRGERADFPGRLRESDLGVAQLAVFRTPEYAIRRTPKLIRHSDPESYKLALVRGRHGMATAGGDAVVDAGDFILFDTSHPFAEQVFAGGETQGQTVVTVARSALPLPARQVDRLLGMRMPGDTGVGSTLSRFLRGLLADADKLGAHDAGRLGHAVVDLVIAVLAHHLDADSSVPPEGRQRSLLARIHAFIDVHLGDSGLSPHAVAAAHHVSVRYLHRLFQQQGTTIGSLIRTRRLEACRRDLAEPLLASRPIHAIAARWGFTRPADFSRMFRTAYGVSPRDYRETAIHTR